MKPFETFEFNKNFGQNFISDKNLLNAIVSDSGISFNDNVLEIGTGAGTLTDAISARAKRVVSFEIDKKLTEFLTDKFATSPNVQVVFKDALKEPIEEICAHFGDEDFHIIANLPYYITTPLIFKFLEETRKVLSITVMVQKEVAEKIVAREGDKNYGITSAILQYYFTCKKTRIVSKKMFTPAPKVDSAVITMRRKPDVPFDADFSGFVRKMFAMKRKTIVNNLSSAGFEKPKILAALAAANVAETARAETLDFGIIRQIFDEIIK
ncbi:MAG: ribosomal RNA small subunit methyltransferase A [Clostridia bacterium]|nr:ribosomal RNA small subunit methyltransferase A [Clostridia bacterium]MBR2433041.1 ribosomal RNA small subunit methyltransferase A [Clostridia bacterium]